MGDLTAFLRCLTYLLVLLIGEELTAVEQSGYPYDGAGRLSASMTAMSGATYQYAADSWMRTLATENGVSTSFSWDGQDLISSSLLGSGGTPVSTTTYTTMNHQPLWTQTTAGSASTNLYYGYDIWGNVSGVVGQIPVGGLTSAPWAYQTKYSYDAWGNATQQNQSTASLGQSSTPSFTYTGVPVGTPWSGGNVAAQQFGYKGQWRDASGLTYLRHRYMDPTLGRFTQVDPAMEGQNYFEYAGGDPVNNSDPTGLAWEWGLDGWDEVPPINSDPKPDFPGLPGWHVESGTVTYPNPKVHGMILQGAVENFDSKIEAKNLDAVNARIEEWNRAADRIHDYLQSQGWKEVGDGTWTKDGQPAHVTFELSKTGKVASAVGMAVLSLTVAGPVGELYLIPRLVVEAAGATRVEGEVAQAGAKVVEKEIAEEEARSELTQGSLDALHAKRAESANAGRLPRSEGNFGGAEGNSPCYSKNSDVNSVTGREPIPFRNGYPDFSRWSVYSKEFPNLNGTKQDFKEGDKAFAASKGWLKEDGTPNQSLATQYRTQKKLTWHHVEDRKTLQLVPTPLHANVQHVGGASDLRQAAEAP